VIKSSPSINQNPINTHHNIPHQFPTCKKTHNTTFNQNQEPSLTALTVSHHHRTIFKASPNSLPKSFLAQTCNQTSPIPIINSKPVHTSHHTLQSQPSQRTPNPQAHSRTASLRSIRPASLKPPRSTPTPCLRRRRRQPAIKLPRFPGRVSLPRDHLAALPPRHGC
jgi:hypothetical protein